MDLEEKAVQARKVVAQLLTTLSDNEKLRRIELIRIHEILTVSHVEHTVGESGERKTTVQVWHPMLRQARKVWSQGHIDDDRAAQVVEEQAHVVTRSLLHMSNDALERLARI